MLSVSPEGTLILSILLPTHFMPLSALIDVKNVLQIRKYQCVCVSMRVPLCLLHTPAHLRVCLCCFCVFLSFHVHALSFLVR